LYSEWLSSSLAGQSELVDFAEFRKIAQEIFAGSADNNGHNTHKD
jgi:hypothetical protein